MGVGKPADLIGAVGRGIDLFDCVLPTRSGRTGQAFTRFGPLNLQERPARRRPPPARPRLRLPGLPRAIRAPICIIWSRPGKFSAPFFSPATISTTISN